MAIPGIPMPMGGMDAFIKGFGFNNDFMRQVQARNALAEQKRQHMEDLKLRKQAADRAGAMEPLRQKILQEQLLRLQHSNDPNYEFQQFQNLMNMMGGSQQPGQAQEQPAAMPQESEMPYGEGQGMMGAQGMPDTGIPMPQGEITPNANKNPFEALKTNPMLRGFFKHKFGFDPLAAAPQTPEEKQAAALNLFNQKEAIKATNKAASGETLTAPIKTKYQNIIGGAASAKPILRKLIQEVKKGQIPGQMIGARFKRDAQASYKGEISTLLDGIRNAYTIPNTDSGTEKAEDKVLRKNGESDDNYAKRLQTILDQIEAREKDATTKLHAGNITAGKTVHLIGPNGEDYDVPESEVDTILKENPGVRRG